MLDCPSGIRTGHRYGIVHAARELFEYVAVNYLLGQRFCHTLDKNDRLQCRGQTFCGCIKHLRWRRPYRRVRIGVPSCTFQCKTAGAHPRAPFYSPHTHRVINLLPGHPAAISPLRTKTRYRLRNLASHAKPTLSQGHLPTSRTPRTDQPTENKDQVAIAQSCITRQTHTLTGSLTYFPDTPQ